MSYKTDKFLYINTEDNPAAQTISDTYVEITGSKCEIKSIYSKPTLMYKFSFYQRHEDTNTFTFLNVKLQKSNDNFSSNIVDVPGQIFNISGDTINNNAEYYRKTVNAFFIIENFDSKYLRLVTRTYSSSYGTILHRTHTYDGGSVSDIYYNPTLIVMEL